MKRLRVILATVLAGIVFCASPCPAEPLDDSQQLFFNQFRYAVQAHDNVQLIRLTHPASIACIAEEDREYYYARILDSLEHVFGRRQAVLDLSAVKLTPDSFKNAKDQLSDDNAKWPVVPELQIIVQYTLENTTAVASLYLAKDNDEWKWIHICAEYE